MGIKRYTFLSVVLIVALGLYVYSFEGAKFTLDLFGIPISLPVAVWVTIPAVLLMLASIAHMMFYSMKAYMSNRAIKKDYEQFIQKSKAAFLGEEYNVTFKTPWFELPGKVLDAMSFKDDATLEELDDPSLKEACEVVSKIKNGEYVDVKKFKLNPDNPLVSTNKMNQLSTDAKEASSVLKSCSLLDSELCKKAFNTLLDNASYTEIKRYEFDLNAQMIIAILKRYVNEEDDLFMDEEELLSLINKVEMSKDEYIEVARVLQNKLNPDTLMAIFEKLYASNVEAAYAYLYVLFELQMIDKAREILENSDEGEYERFKIILFMRDHGKNIDTSFFY